MNELMIGWMDEYMDDDDDGWREGWMNK